MASSTMWAVRCPGGPTKVVKSKKPISENAVKELYLESFAKIRTEVDKDKELKWPILKPIDETEFQKDFAQVCAPSPNSGREWRIVEV